MTVQYIRMFLPRDEVPPFVADSADVVVVRSKANAPNRALP
jgi:hypothetical protein